MSKQSSSGLSVWVGISPKHTIDSLFGPKSKNNKIDKSG